LLKRLGQVYEGVCGKIEKKFGKGERLTTYYNKPQAMPDGHSETLVPRLRLEFLDLIKEKDKSAEIK
jgi:hypothetical protein